MSAILAPKKKRYTLYDKFGTENSLVRTKSCMSNLTRLVTWCYFTTNVFLIESILLSIFSALRVLSVTLCFSNLLHHKVCA